MRFNFAYYKDYFANFFRSKATSNPNDYYYNTPENKANLNAYEVKYMVAYNVISIDTAKQKPIALLKSFFKIYSLFSSQVSKGLMDAGESKMILEKYLSFYTEPDLKIKMRLLVYDKSGEETNTYKVITDGSLHLKNF